MDHFDFLGWLYEGGGMDLYWEFYRDILKLNVVAWPVGGASPQAFGWFKRPIKNLADFKGMKCRQTGIVAEIFQKMGMQTVNMPAARSCPRPSAASSTAPNGSAASRTCASVCRRCGNTTTRPGMHESNSMLEVIINSDVWKGLTPAQQEAVRAAVSETFSAGA
jgi:TRAP-type mannitol/chloroaromatic compound transport system substrate-binding protein